MVKIGNIENSIGKINFIATRDNRISFDRLWIAHLSIALNLIGNKKAALLAWLIKNRDGENCINKSLAQIAKESKVSFCTAQTSIKKLERCGYITRPNGLRGGVYKLSHKLICKGGAERMTILIDYRKTQTAETPQGVENQKNFEQQQEPQSHETPYCAQESQNLNNPPRPSQTPQTTQSVENIATAQKLAEMPETPSPAQKQEVSQTPCSNNQNRWIDYASTLYARNSEVRFNQNIWLDYIRTRDDLDEDRINTLFKATLKLQELGVNVNERLNKAKEKGWRRIIFESDQQSSI